MTGPKNNHVKQVLGSFFDPDISLGVASDPITSFRVFGCIGIQGRMFTKNHLQLGSTD